jgi:hypothetical protein
MVSFWVRPPWRSFNAAAAGGGAIDFVWGFRGTGFAGFTAFGFGRATAFGFRASRGSLGAAGTFAAAAEAVGRTRTCEERRGEELSCVGGGGV